MMLPIAVLLVQAAAPNAQAAASAREIPWPTPTPVALAHDTGTLRHSHGRTPPVLRAERIRSAAPPRIDGRLDDAVWAQAEAAGGFRQVEPNDGADPSEPTEVRIAYDDGAIYVAARMFDRDPAGVRTQLSRRDSYTSADRFTVTFDSYHDHRTGFSFSVNASGVKQDAIWANDQGGGDAGWDPVWEVATQRDSLGWTAEFRIPFSQLRYPAAPVQAWGVNFSRWIQRRGEFSQYSWRPQTASGNASYFGHLVGLDNLPQPRRLELLPYATARQERFPSAGPLDPFNDGSREFASAGLDLKYGLTSNLTVDATFNPDFGQVEADPAFVNLSAFEQFFSERRPFFVEGSQIFQFGGNQQFFYSRRIGRSPQGFASHSGFVDQPDASTILGATKITGRTAGGWSVGLLEALTAREYATVDSSGARFRDEVEPLTNYGTFRAKRDFRGGASTIGLIATSVVRDLPQDGRLDFLRSSAWAGGFDFTHRFARNRWSLSGSLGLSTILGDTLAIQRAQRSSARYYQRPDADHVEYDATRTSLSGITGSLGLSRIQGSWTGGVSTSWTTPGFEINDAGFQSSADRLRVSGNLNRRWTRPGRVFQFANTGISGGATWNFGLDNVGLSASWFAYGQFKSFWSVNANLFANARTRSDGLTRGGPLGVGVAGYGAFLGVGTDYRKPWQVFIGGNASDNQLHAYFVNTFVDFTWRPATNVSLSFAPSWFRGVTRQQPLMNLPDTLNPAMYGRRYVFGEILQQSVDATMRVNFTVSPTLSLQLYTQPFVFTGGYSRYKELTRPATTDYLVYGETPGSTRVDGCGVDAVGTVTPCAAGQRATVHQLDPDGAGPRDPALLFDPDFASRSLRGNAVLRWEYRPGSTLFLVWTTSCSAFAPEATFRPGRDMGHLCRGASNDVFAVKLNWWLSR